MKKICYLLMLLLVDLTASSHPFGGDDDRKVFPVVDRQPTFPGGSEALLQWLKDHIRYPALAEDQGIQGQVVAAFWVEKDGSVCNCYILRSPHEELSKEVLRLLRFMPRWVPGCVNGRATRERYTMPVNFRLLPPDKYDKQIKQ